VYATFAPAEIFPWKSTALPWHIEYMFQAMFYMVFGYLFRHNMEEWFDQHNGLRMRVASTVIYGVLLVVSCVTDIRANAVVDILYQYIVSIAGILTLVLIAKVLKTNPYINFVGQNTLIYFALHGKVYSVIQTLLKKFTADIYMAILGNTIASTFFCLLLSLVLSIVLIIPAYLINRYFPFVVGRKKENISK
jgi:xanthine/uracil permease